MSATSLGILKRFQQSLVLLEVAFIIIMNVASAFSANAAAIPRFVGFDLGTSGCRISIIEQSASSDSSSYKEIYTQAITWNDPSQKSSSGSGSGGSYDDPDAWMNAITTLLKGAADSDNTILSTIQSICISGTSASCCIVDVDSHKVTRAPRMYNYDVVASRSKDEDPIYAIKAMELLDKYAPAKHTARAQSGSLAKLLTWNEEQKLKPSEVLCHQADYISMRLRANDKVCGKSKATNQWNVASDWHNCLKLGYDVQQQEWPEWMIQCLADATNRKNDEKSILKLLPQQVVSPGQPVGTISEDMAQQLGLSSNVVIVGGTTDSNAAFFAAAGANPVVGTAVTSLGSTLAMKYLSSKYVEDATVGVYSHRFPSVFLDNDEKNTEAWLAGGASNVGCAILRQEEFSTDELIQLSTEIDPSKDSPLEYYPLLKKGERFPVADSNKEPVLTPQPDNRRDYLHGLLQGIANVERDGFQTLGNLGAAPARPKVVLTCGGGSQNDMWSRLRERRLNEAFYPNQQKADGKDGDGVKVLKADNTEASYGAAILAAASFNN